MWDENEPVEWDLFYAGHPGPGDDKYPAMYLVSGENRWRIGHARARRDLMCEKEISKYILTL